MITTWYGVPHLEDHIVEEVDEKVKQTLRKIILAEFKGCWADVEELLIEKRWER